MLTLMMAVFELIHGLFQGDHFSGKKPEMS